MNDNTALIMQALIIAFTIIGLSILVVVYLTNVNECTSNPLVYGANKYTESYGYDFIGTGTLLINDMFAKAPTFNFDKDNLTIE